MRRIVLASTLLLSACASAPLQPEVATPTPLPQSPRGNGLVGLTTSELVSRLGNPALQVREGVSLKLQFRNPRCVIDAYLYPQAGNLLRVTHVDARAPSGVDTNQAVCVATFASVG